MKILKLNLKHKTVPIEIENGLFQKAAQRIKELFGNRKIMLVTDSNAGPIYADKLLTQLRDLSIETGMYTVPAGESSKSHDQLLKIYDAFARFGLTRRDIVTVVGGGVTGDLAGYAASTWLRGTGLVHIPTSLIAMVDSSIGGKVAVNIPHGKNLVGSFYHPEIVLIDPLLLETMPDKYFFDGIAEVIKYGLISDENLFEMLEGLKNRESIMEHIEEIIFKCCDIKINVVEQDETENGLRMILNFGHTFGHAIEKVFGYEKFTHGEAISMGMVYISELSEKLGFCSPELPKRIRSVLAQYGLPADLPEMDNKAVIDAVLVDKKARTNDINLVLIKKPGTVFIKKFPKEQIGGMVNENRYY